MQPDSSDQSAQSQNQPQLLGYDMNGNPLYGTPSAQPSTQTPVDQPLFDQPTQVVHVSRAADPVAPEISAETKARHAASTQQYPHLNLSEAEYVVADVPRHPIGAIVPMIIGAFVIILLLTAAFSYPLLVHGIDNSSLPSVGLVVLVGILVSILIAAGTYVAIWVYFANKFYLTNESVIQEIQMSLLAKREQTASLANIEDVSFTQHGLLQSMLDYGSIRLSTEGDETTYRMDYVRQPRKQVALLNNAVESFKNGRPVGAED